jgi:probable F420-dependent oxidoreductase
MRFSFRIPNTMHVLALLQPWEAGLGGPDISRAIRLADEVGFDKATVAEHFIIPKAHRELTGYHFLHSTAALSFAAGLTKKLKLTSVVNLLPLQHPVVQAKAWATLDWLSGGRAEPMFGVGWLAREYELLNVPFKERGRMADEYVASMIELWTKDEPSFEGKYVSFKDVGFEPKPVQKPCMPIWFGGDAPAVLKRIARFGDGWSPNKTPPESFPECLDFIRSQPGYRGQKIGVFFAMELLRTGSGHKVIEDDRGIGTWNRQRSIDRCHWLKELGVTEVCIPQPKLDDFSAYLDWLRWVAAEVIPAVA